MKCCPLAVQKCPKRMAHGLVFNATFERTRKILRLNLFSHIYLRKIDRYNEYLSLSSARRVTQDLICIKPAPRHTHCSIDGTMLLHFRQLPRKVTRGEHATWITLDHILQNSCRAYLCCWLSRFVSFSSGKMLNASGFRIRSFAIWRVFKQRIKHVQFWVRFRPPHAASHLRTGAYQS